MTPRVYVPRDAGALSLGADDVVTAIERQARRERLPLHIVRNGSRGLYWLEPLVEVDAGRGRIAYGPVRAVDVPGLFRAGFLQGAPHALHLGAIEGHPWLASQQRLTFGRVGREDPLSLESYVRQGGYAGLHRALELGPEATVRELTASGLRGRGGAAFPAGVKWHTAREQAAAVKYVVCNADEGDSGTFADRMLMEGDPFALIEGMTIAGVTVGASRGYVYLRAEYPHARRSLGAAIEVLRRAGRLGSDLLGSGRDFDIDVRVGAGAYVCGEETSMLESLEGRRGEVRVRPPPPAVKGLFGAPTVVNNVVTLATVPVVLARGAEFYRGYGRAGSHGTLPIQLGGNVRRPGLIERAFGLTVRELLEDYGGGSATARPIRAVQIGGPLGAFLPASQFDTPLEYEALAAMGAVLGHGGVVAFDDTVDMVERVRETLRFCAHESCGKCAPCRIGSVRGEELVERIRRGFDRERDLALLAELCDTLEHGSLCGLGGMTPFPVRSALRHFPGDFRGTR